MIHSKKIFKVSIYRKYFWSRVIAKTFIDIKKLIMLKKFVWTLLQRSL